ncbi:S8 family serine peptidase [Actinoplanes sp. HUAS TT8]|uniref:S8 family serine peptidase n=1 Tax=Actinoplanes sp. HUAS TT8 TaxID=3447453 RepID=UPI003F51B987
MRVVATCLVPTLLLGVLAAPATAAESSVLLDVGLVSRADRAAVLAPLGDAVLGSRDLFDLAAITVEVPGDQVTTVLAGLKADAKVRYAEVDPQVTADGDTGDANRARLTVNQVPGAWTWGTGSPAITVAVVDTGVTATAGLGADRLRSGYDAVDDDGDAADEDGHGTLVAGIAAQVCGQCRILPVRALRHDPAGGRATGHAADLAAGITWAAGAGAQVINVSASAPVNAGVFKDALTRAGNLGSLVVASAGHDPARTAYPAANSAALAVGSVSSDGTPDSGTPTGNGWVDIAAVDGLTALGPDGQAHVLTGTSASTAVVAGAAALNWAAASSTTSAWVRTALTSNARRLDPLGTDPPLLDAAGMMFRAGGDDLLPPTIRASGLPATVGPASVAITPDIVDDHAIEHVDVIHSGTTTRWWTGLPAPRLQATPGQDYATYVSLRAYDYAGRLGETYELVRFDGVAPTGKFEPGTPASGAHVRGAAPVVFSSPDGDDLVSVKLNGVTMAHTAGSGLWRQTAAPTAAGLYRIDFTDAAGNTSAIGRKVVVDNTGPTLKITSAPGNKAKVKGTVTVRASASDTSGIAKVQLLVNGKVVATDTRAAYVLMVNPAKVARTMKVQVRAYDKLGNVRASSTRTWYRR